jgi:zinc and cadmium transporter
MTLAYILMATFLGGVVSVLLAAVLSAPLLGMLVKHLVSLSTGVLLGTALLHVLPEAFETGTAPSFLFMTLLGGLIFFFLLEKAELYRHGHHHEHDEHHHHHGFDHDQAGRGGLSVLVGDSIHNFCDGILIAAAFMLDTQVGVVTALAIIAHEIPQEVGDYIVLVNAGFSRQRALFYNALSGLAAVLGGVLGYVLIEPWQAYLPYLMVVAASSFIYVAVADLIPQLQRRLSWRETVAQVFWLAAGLGFTAAVVSTLHGQAPQEPHEPPSHQADSISDGAAHPVGHDASPHDQHGTHH